MAKAVAVIDIGITHLKLLAIDADARVLAERRAVNPVRPGPPYLHLDVERVYSWLLEGLHALAEVVDICAVIPCCHGSAAALLSDDGLVLPVMHYEAEPPASIIAAYAEIEPPFSEVLAPTNPKGLTLARQLFWQQRCFPDEFDRVRYILCYAQYWAWRLSGIAVSEVTSLGAQTHLWTPRAGDFSSLTECQGWRGLFPPLRPAWQALGPILPDIARSTGLRADTPLLCGIHDSSANYFRYLAGGWKNFSLMSTGTWIINFNPGFAVENLSADYDTNTNSDVYGRALACSRFMGGREYALLAGDARPPICAEDIVRLVESVTLALPSFTDSGGPYPGSGGRGRIVGPEPQTDGQRTALATLYCALMARAALAHIGSDNDIVIDGAFADNAWFCRLIGALHPERAVWTAAQPDGSAQGAALLWQWPLHPVARPAALGLQKVEPAAIRLDEYAATWQQMASETNGE